ncbi:hypothetical protein V6N11_042695 [Hibiscus sabdariffa]|uniref:Zinc finger GRF-type domain-containing protein n=1 Tax=Hibiscus sabdariffa TaxID=183260 RepID=A0ABR2QX28_9ROSI
MEAKGRKATTRISNWHEGMKEPSAFPLCGFPAQLRTSWSNDNPGRRFFGCKNHGSLVHHAWMKTNGDGDDVAQTAGDDDVVVISPVALLTCKMFDK